MKFCVAKDILNSKLRAGKWTQTFQLLETKKSAKMKIFNGLTYFFFTISSGNFFSPIFGRVIPKDIAGFGNYLKLGYIILILSTFAIFVISLPFEFVYDVDFALFR